ncbi:MAG: threonine synthase [Myxococcales bacterium]|nr:threonine synthase [Myxococcales bacterium]
MSLLGYRCSACEASFSPDEERELCAHCDANLDVRIQLEGIERESIERCRDPSLWRYAPLLPVAIPGIEDGPLRTVGGTPLMRADRVATRFGMVPGRVWIKDEGRQPTGSLKDRASAIVVQRARRLGRSPILTASTGNAGVALAAMARAAGIEAVILLPEGAPAAKIAQLRVFGARLCLVRGSYDDAFRLSKEAAAALGWYCRNTGQNPFTIEGKKTVSFEIAEALGWRAPGWIVVPVGDGNIITGVHKGFAELLALGWIDRMPRLLGVQAEGSSPIARAWERGDAQIVAGPASTRADSICAGDPADGARALRAVRQTGGAFVRVSDASILEAIPALGREAAIFAEPAAAAAHAGLGAARASGVIDAGEEVLLLITGTGLKDVGAAGLALEGQPPTIDANLDALRAAISTAL